jgi:hypothetical protein
MRSSADFEGKEAEALTPSSDSQTSHGGGIASDNGDGTLLLNGGQAQFVSSLHFALLADEVSDDLDIPFPPRKVQRLHPYIEQQPFINSYPTYNTEMLNGIIDAAPDPRHQSLTGRQNR